MRGFTVTMYIPRHFAGDIEGARRLIAAHPFATLVTSAGGTPHVTHLPLTLEAESMESVPIDSRDSMETDPIDFALVGHMARPNPHWQAFGAGESVAIFHGPHAFISRGWYADPADNVPTWNYAVVHATGRPALLDDTQVRGVVERLAAHFEPPSLAPIREEKMAGLMKGIVAFRMPIARLDVKFKMSQNKPADERARLREGLEAAGTPVDVATAAWMKAHGAG